MDKLQGVKPDLEVVYCLYDISMDFFKSMDCFLTSLSSVRLVVSCNRHQQVRENSFPHAKRSHPCEAVEFSKALFQMVLAQML